MVATNSLRNYVITRITIAVIPKVVDLTALRTPLLNLASLFRAGVRCFKLGLLIIPIIQVAEDARSAAMLNELYGSPGDSNAFTMAFLLLLLFSKPVPLIYPNGSCEVFLCLRAPSDDAISYC